MGVGATTEYRVLTRYMVDDRPALEGSRRLKTTADELDRASSRAVSSVGRLSLGFGTLLRFYGPLSGIATVVGALTKTFQNLRMEQEASLAVASQFNLAFQFDEDPAKNFLASMHESRSFMRDIISDAARLPGELSDFMAAVSTMGLPVLAQGGDKLQLRRMLGNLSITAPAAGQGMQEGGRQVMRMLTGQTSVGDNPLFAMLHGAGLLPNAASFNTERAADRLRMLDAALERFAGNPALRTEISHTFSTQWGTLMDNIFGVQGVLGQIGKDPFADLLSGLEGLNRFLSENKDTFVFYGKLFLGSGGPQHATPGIPWLSFLSDPVGMAFQGVTREMADQQRGAFIREETLRRLYHQGPGVLSEEKLRDLRVRAAAEAVLGGGTGLKDDPLYQVTRRQVEADLGRNLLMQGGPGAGAPPSGKRKPPTITGDVVTNHITIKVDLKSDDSPEAIAVKLAKAMEKASQHPKRSARAPRIGPGSHPTT